MSEPVLDLALAAMEARLDARASGPVALAFSGGGDSLALLLIATHWAGRVGRRLIVFTVDHRLQEGSSGWARWCATRAGALGLTHRTLVWEGEKPASGVPAAARTARHRLIAQAAREAGARVILFGHTLDDALEADLMASRGVRIGAPLAWAPSPVWPEGRGQFLLRPLLGARRADLRAGLSARGEGWLEDPANRDLAHARVRARRDLAEGVGPAAPRPRKDGCSPPAVTVGPGGDLSLGKAALKQEDGSALLGAAICCVSGRERPPRRSAVERLLQRITSGEAAATLGGVRIAAGDGEIVLAREGADRSQGGRVRLALASGPAQVFDGRFEVEARACGLTMTALGGHMRRLPRRSRALLHALHPLARAALPALIDGSGAVSCPTLEPDPRVRIACLVQSRLAAARGMVQVEAEIA